MVSIIALVQAGQRRVVRVADEPDRHAPLVPQVVESLPDLSGEGIRNGGVLVLVPHWRDKISDARPRRLAFPVSHFANGLHPAYLDELGFIGRIRLVRPFPKGLVAGQMPLDRLAGLGRVDLADARSGRHRQESDNQQEMAQLTHSVHLLPGPRTSDRFGGAPRRQKTSGSMVRT